MASHQNVGQIVEDEQKSNSLSSGRLTTTRLAVAIIIVTALTLFLARLDEINVTWLKNSTNITLLNHVIAATAGEPVPATTSLPRISVGTGMNGTQARALARIAQARGNQDQAEYWLQLGLRDSETADLTRFELCRHYLEYGQVEKARDTCRDSIATAAFWLDAGFIANEDGLVEEAVVQFDMATVVDPSSALSWYQLGLVHDKLGSLERAVFAFEQVLILKELPSPNLYSHLGDAYLALGQTEQGRSVLEEGLRHYPDQRQYYLSMARSFRDNDDLEVADRWYVRLLQRWPRDAQAWALRGENAFEAGEPSEAVGYFEDAVRYDADAAGYWLGLASAASAAGRITLASDAYEQAQVLRPADANIMINAGRFYLESDQLDRAETAFARALTLEPSNTEAAEKLATLQSSNE